MPKSGISHCKKVHVFVNGVTYKNMTFLPTLGCVIVSCVQSHNSVTSAARRVSRIITLTPHRLKMTISLCRTARYCRLGNVRCVRTVVKNCGTQFL